MLRSLRDRSRADGEAKGRAEGLGEAVREFLRPRGGSQGWRVARSMAGKEVSQRRCNLGLAGSSNQLGDSYLGAAYIRSNAVTIPITHTSGSCPLVTSTPGSPLEIASAALLALPPSSNIVADVRFVN